VTVGLKTSMTDDNID